MHLAGGIVGPLPVESSERLGCRMPVISWIVTQWLLCDGAGTRRPQSGLIHMPDLRKKPPAPSAKSRRAAMTAPDLKAQIAHEISIALERLGADEELLAIIGSWRDTLPDEEVLALYRDYNATGKALRRPQ